MGKMILDDLRKRLERLAISGFYIRYQEYVERWRPCES